MTRNPFIKRTAGLFLAASLLSLGLLTVSEARAERKEEKDLTLVPQQEAAAACTEGTTPTGMADCERWYYMMEKKRPDAWKEDHPAFSKKQRWYHVGEPKVAAGPRVIILEGVKFEFDKATIRPESFPILERNLPALQSDVTVKVVGHADSRGTDGYNQNLSERRAEAIRNYYVRRGVPADRLQAEGRGESEPIAVNEPVDGGGDTEAEHDYADPGRAKNRRIELHIQDITVGER